MADRHYILNVGQVQRRIIIVLLVLFNSMLILAQDKIQYLQRVEELKGLINDKFWPSFNDTVYRIPIDYHENGPFVMNMSINGGMGSAVMHCSSPEITFSSVPFIWPKMASVINADDRKTIEKCTSIVRRKSGQKQ